MKIINVLLLLLIIALIPYVSGYFLLCDSPRGYSRMRIYPNVYIASAYRPAAFIHSKVKGKPISVWYDLPAGT